MIKSMTFNQSTQHHPLSYVAELDSIKSMGGTIEFTDGLNIIVGPNGSGKSSIVNVLSQQLAANITGYSMISSSWLRGISDLRGNLHTSADVVHDGRPVLFCCPREGISGRTDKIDEGAFARDILLDQFQSSHESTGEKSNRLLSPFIQTVLSDQEFPESIGADNSVKDINDVWSAKLRNALEQWLTPKIPLGKPTLILDEPETGLGVLNQILLWKHVLTNPKVLARFQVILVSHSIESINIPGAHYIELKSGYLDTCRKAISGDAGIKEMQQQASKLDSPLSKSQRSLLNKIKNAQEPLRMTGTDNQQYLLKIGFIEVYRRSKPQKSSTKTGRQRLHNLRREYEEVMLATALGSQYLTMHNT